MNLQLEAAWQIHRFLTTRRIPYAIIGGLAVQYWGEPRFTRDLDVTLLVPYESEKGLLSEVLAHFAPRITDALDFALKNRVLLIRTEKGCDVDISLGVPGYEEKVMARTVDFNIGGGRTVKLCSAEDLIIHKAVAGRPQDCTDIEGIVLRQGRRLDGAYIQHWLKIFSRILETEEIYQRFAVPWKRMVQMKRSNEKRI